MITFKAVCKSSLTGMTYGEIYTVEISTLNSLAEYIVMDKIGDCTALSSAQFHKNFEITEEDKYDFNLFLEDLANKGILENEEETNYFSDECMQGFDIADAIQYMVLRIQDKCFAEESEDGELQFITSCLYEEDNNTKLSCNKIILTIKHHRYTNSRVLFPSSSIYGFDCLADIMRSMYNQTM